MDPASMFFAYEWAVERARRSREAGDLAGMAIAEGQADHWFVQWLIARGWNEASPALEPHEMASFVATAAASAS